MEEAEYRDRGYKVDTTTAGIERKLRRGRRPQPSGLNRGAPRQPFVLFKPAFAATRRCVSTVSHMALRQVQHPTMSVVRESPGPGESKGGRSLSLPRPQLGPPRCLSVFGFDITTAGVQAPESLRSSLGTA
jgi:hypothetical protein